MCTCGINFLVRLWRWRWKMDKQLLFPVAMGYEDNHNSSCVRGNFVHKEIWELRIKGELNCQWDGPNNDDWYPLYIKVKYLPRNKAKDDLCVLEHCSLHCWIVSICPCFLLCFISALWACSILATSPLAATMALEGILRKTICHIDLLSCVV